ncbi:MAG: pirin family protein [bacterium]|nr:pirin family protein [bacterium]
MSWQPAEPPDVEPRGCPALELVLAPRERDLGGFSVRRALPAPQRHMVGPFIFWDQMGPARFAPGRGIDVRPHPHIGLATVTYLFEGEILHRDSLGTVQPIRPGAVNWMTAGRGIVHSERTPPAARAAGPALSGIQAWVALPREHEETAPAFSHHAAEALPVLDDAGARVRVIAGTFAGARSPVPVRWETLYVDVQLRPGGRFALPSEHAERALYVAEGRVVIAGDDAPAGRMLVFRPGDTIVIAAPADTAARVLCLGGAPMDGPRHVWWNFVSSSRERLDAAAADWEAGRFPAVPGETERIPLPAR